MPGAGGGSMDTTTWSIGVDFGTAFSKAACTRVMSAGANALRDVKPLRVGEAGGGNRPFLVPSSLFLDRSRVHFGHWAVKRIVAANLEERELVRSFKTILGANDFEGALNFYPRATVDPDRMFRLRDLIVLFLAYLLALVDAAAARELRVTGIVSKARLRFTRPGWIPDRIAAAHEAMSGLFSQAHLVHRQLGNELLAPEGVDYARARAALDVARADQSKFASLDGGIYEASAVGLCHYGDRGVPNLLLIVDVGGGTTDVAALMRAPYGQEIQVIRAGRRTINIAGDHFDTALIELLISKAKLTTDADRAAVWHKVAPIVRELKEELFSKGAIQVVFRGARISCSARELERQRTFKNGIREIRALYKTCLAELVEAGRDEKVRSIGVVLAGGGAHLPAIRRMILKRRWTGLMQVKHLPDTPLWVGDMESAHDLGPVFSQLSAAFGAAISKPETIGDEGPEAARTVVIATTGVL